MSQTVVILQPATARRWWILAVVVAAQFMFVVDAFIVNVAIPSIRTDLGASSSEIAAVLGLYQIGYATLVITGGRLGDIYGRRRLFVLGVLAFSAASLGCGLAGSALALVLARLAQGATAALMVPQVLATIHTLFPDPAARGRAFGAFGIALGLGGAAGFLLGGVLVSLDIAGLGWRAVFFVNLPVGAALAWAGWRLIPGGAARPDMPLDLRGAGILFASLMALIGPVMAADEFGWPWWIAAVLVAGIALLALFLRHVRGVARAGGLPLVDLGLFADRPFVRGLCAAFAFQFGNTSFYLLMTLFTQGVLAFSPFDGGLAVVPLALAFTAASFWAGKRSARVGIGGLLQGNVIQIAGLALVAAVAGLVAHPGVPVLMAVLAVFGIGQGLVMAPLAGIVLATVERAHAGSAAGLLNTVQQAAGATGIALVGATYFAAGADRTGVLAALALLGVSTLATSALLLWCRRGQAAAAGLTV